MAAKTFLTNKAAFLDLRFMAVSMVAFCGDPTPSISDEFVDPPPSTFVGVEPFDFELDEFATVCKFFRRRLSLRFAR